MELTEILSRIETLPADWHGSGLLTFEALEAIARHAGRVGTSMETGSGISTLLFSHLSERHLAFSVDDARSISAVRESGLFQADHVEWIEGPTQQTLPRYAFAWQFDVALLDGPHGYPFPDLEYYYVYPQIKAGGLLIVDDIHIPTIGNLYRFLREDEMWDLVEVTGRRTAFFRRTDAETFSPIHDGWWLQRYNDRHFPRTLGQRIRRIPPEAVRRRVKSFLGKS